MSFFDLDEGGEGIVKPAVRYRLEALETLDPFMPGVKTAVKGWTLKDEDVIGGGDYGYVYRVCLQGDCNYALKIGQIRLSEIEYNEKCAKHGVCKPVIDAWKCPLDEHHFQPDIVFITALLHENLGTRLARATSEQELWEIITRVMKVLLKCHHDVKLAHGDIKPDNIMLDKNGKIFLIDLGKSREIYNTCKYNDPNDQHDIDWIEKDWDRLARVYRRASRFPNPIDPDTTIADPEIAEFKMTVMESLGVRIENRSEAKKMSVRRAEYEIVSDLWKKTEEEIRNWY